MLMSCSYVQFLHECDRVDYSALQRQLRSFLEQIVVTSKEVLGSLSFGKGHMECVHVPDPGGSEIHCARKNRRIRLSAAAKRPKQYIGSLPTRCIRIEYVFGRQRGGIAQAENPSIGSLKDSDNGIRFESNPSLRLVIERALERTHIKIDLHDRSHYRFGWQSVQQSIALPEGILSEERSRALSAWSMD